MTAADPRLVVRAAAVYLPVFVTVAAHVWRRPTARDWTGAVLAALWNLPVVLALHLLAMRYAWWRFDADGGLLLGMPVDLYLAWAWLWGAVPALLLPSAPLVLVALALLTVDVVTMPAASPIVQLGPWWIAGDALGLAVGAVPAQLLARWTAQDRLLYRRVFLQVIVFAGLVLFVVPAVAIDASATRWVNPFDRPAWQMALIAQLLALPAMIGLGAVQEFALRGGGTPFPYDAPKRLVTSGLYAYVRNPMQIVGVVLLVLVGVAVHNFWVAAAGVMAHVYSSGLAGWDESADLGRRFGDAWRAYRAAVGNWIPRSRPWFPRETPPSRLSIAGSRDVGERIGEWFERRRPAALVVVFGNGERTTYQPGDGSDAVDGVAALARALEHVHLGWALLAALVRLPIVLPAAQAIARRSASRFSGPSESQRIMKIPGDASAQ